MNRFCNAGLTCLLLFLSTQLYSQKKIDTYVDAVYEHVSLATALKDLEKRFDIKFLYIEDQLKDIEISATFDHEPISSALAIMLEVTPFQFQYLDDKIMIIKDIKKEQKKIVRFSIAGKITDQYDQPLSNVEIYIPALKKTTTSDGEGHYTLRNIPKRKYLVVFKKEDYYRFSETFNVASNDEINIKLVQASKFSLNESAQEAKSIQGIILLDKEVSIENFTGTVQHLLTEIENKAGVSFAYDINQIPVNKEVSFHNTKAVRDILYEIFQDSNIEFMEWGNKIVIRKRKDKGQKFTISGTVREMQTGENMPGAIVKVKGTQIGVNTNAYGFYSLTLSEWNYTLEFSYVGYKLVKKEVDLIGNIRMDIELEDAMSELKEVVVTSQSNNQNVDNIAMSTVTLDVKTLKAMPAFMGEVDLIKSIILLPGVTTVGEGATGFNVRGGAVDQNLVLLDEAQVYNASHLFGFFSVFNSDAIKDSKLYKGGIPAIYGGRLSSVLDVTQKEGNDKKITGSGGIGLVSCKLAIEGPLKKNKGSFIIAGRKTYADAFFKDKFIAQRLNLPTNNQATFYDLNAKLNYTINNKNRIFLSGYFGRDSYRLSKIVAFSWGNTTGTFRWNHLFNEKLFANVTAVYSNYDYSQGEPEGYFAYKGKAGIINYNLKSDFTYYANEKHKIDFGLSSILYHIEPGRAWPINDSSSYVKKDIPDDYAVESAVHVSDEYAFNSKFTVYYGLRYSAFSNVAPETVYTYRSGEPRTLQSLQDTLVYRNGQITNTYNGFEPRLSVKFQLTNNSSVKVSYNRMRQYIHMISNTTAVTPLDIWKASNRNVKPQVGDQIALGYFRNLRENTLEASVEIYYKKIQNLVDYRNGADLILNPMLDADLLQGHGRAYGIEFMIKKKIGRLTGWTSYTYSRTERKMQPDGNSRDQINFGNWFPSNYDQPNKVNVIALYQLSKRISISADFTYNTGRPATFPDAQYVYMGKIIPQYSTRNMQRIPDYHRLDVSATLEGRGNKWWKGSWTLSIYNLYGRKNAYSIFFRQVENTNNTETVKLSMLGSIVPSLSYNFKF